MLASQNLAEPGGTEEQGAARMPAPTVFLPGNTGFHFISQQPLPQILPLLS